MQLKWLFLELLIVKGNIKHILFFKNVSKIHMLQDKII